MGLEGEGLSGNGDLDDGGGVGTVPWYSDIELVLHGQEAGVYAEQSTRRDEHDQQPEI